MAPLLPGRAPGGTGKLPSLSRRLDRSAMAMASGEAGAYLSGLDALGTNPAGLSGVHPGMERHLSANALGHERERHGAQLAHRLPSTRRWP
jgi:hypothetical protein